MPTQDIEKRRAQGRGHYVRNKEKYAAKNREWVKNNPEAFKAIQHRSRVKRYAGEVWRRARDRAARKGVPFTIAISDVVLPEFCPVLGVRLDYSVGTKDGKHKACSPSLDRRVPELGYVPGNVIVISFRANTIKSNATPEELRRVADFFWAMS